MSSTNRGATRQPRDHYQTPAAAVQAILPHLGLRAPILEPSAGEGAIIAALLNAGRCVSREDVRAVEIDAALASACALATGVRPEVDDFLRWAPRSDCAPRTVIGNPPYSLAREFVEHALHVAPNAQVAFLLRLPFLESRARADLFASRMPDVYVLARRPSFTGGATDSCAYMWAVWPSMGRTRDSGQVRVLA